ncbi:MAG: UDP-N-acetylmuramate--L-alanine ligase [Candidatus Bipolaricaulaceae bacterium]
MTDLGDKVHLVGIGGEGMAALAQLLREAGVDVSGSDLRDSPRLGRLRDLGIRARVGHSPDAIPPGVGTVAFSSAVPPNNPELVVAQANGLRVRPRLWALRELLRARRLVAVVGTHGKTTTVTWVAHLLGTTAGECGYYVGADVPQLGSARLGRGPFALELDESDGRFTGVEADVAVLTSIDTDHLDVYGGYSGLRRAFARFLGRAGKVALCVDDPGASSMLAVRGDALTYGLDDAAALRARGLQFSRSRAEFEVWFHGRPVGEVELPAPGVHNVRNALAAAAGGVLLGLPLADICASLSAVPRPRRRLEVLEENGYLVVDDYAHHPRELAAGLAALRGGWPERGVTAIFQPHRYSRTVRHAAGLGAVLARADRSVVTEVYGAFERPLPGVSGALVAQAVRKAGGQAVFRPTLPAALEAAAEVIRPGDVVACFGAGDIWQLAREMARGLSRGS